MPHILATGRKDVKTVKLWNIINNMGSLKKTFEQELVDEHPLIITTLGGDKYTLHDWGRCKDLKAALCKLAPENALGKATSFELLGYLGHVGSDSTQMQQVDGKYGSNDRRQMIAGKGFDYELALVYTAAAAPVAATTGGGGGGSAGDGGGGRGGVQNQMQAAGGGGGGRAVAARGPAGPARRISSESTI